MVSLNCAVPSSLLRLCSPTSGSEIWTASAPWDGPESAFFYTIAAYYLFLCVAVWFVPIIPTLREAGTGGSSQFQGHLICITSSKTARPRECNSVPQTTITRHTCHQQTISWVSPSILLLSETFDAEGFPLGSQIMEEKHSLLYGSFSLWVSINCQVYENPNLMITQTKKKILTALFGSLCCFLFPERPDLFKARLDNQGRPLSIYFTFSLIVMNWAKQ